MEYQVPLVKLLISQSWLHVAVTAQIPAQVRGAKPGAWLTPLALAGHLRLVLGFALPTRLNESGSSADMDSA